MTKINTILFVLSALCLTMSCTKDSPKDDPKKETYEGHFECRGVTYETLQDAVDACVASGEFSEITLIGNVKDDGAVIPDLYDNCVMLNLSAFKYVLNEGKCLDFGNNDAILMAGGGGIEGNGVIIKSAGEGLSFCDNIIIKGNIVASSDVCFEEDFLGKFEGSLSLDGGNAFFSSEYADMHIIDLTTKGSDAGIQVFNAPKGGIRIDNVISDTKCPVCAMKEGLVEIKSGATPHVHKFSKSNETPADCCTHSHYTMSCPECGYQYVEYAEDEEEYGPCNPENLVYVAAQSATTTDLGYTERWLCPFCGKAYADKGGKTLLEDGGMLLPTSLLLDYDVRDYFGHAMNDLFQPTNGSTLAILGIVLSLVNLFNGISSLLPNTYWSDLNGQLAEMSRKLDEINKKLDAVLTLINAQQSFNMINERYAQINAIAPLTTSTFNNIANIFASGSTMTEKERIQEIKANVELWHNHDGGPKIGKFGPLSERLLSQYPDAALFGGRTIPKMYEIGANTAFLWEHDGYDFRKLLNTKDMIFTCYSSILEMIYVSDVVKYPKEYMREDAIRIIKNRFKLYGNELMRDFERMDSRKDKVRRLNTSNITFSKEICWVDPYCWFLGNWKNRDVCRLPRDDKYKEISIKTCNTIMSSNMLDMPFTTEMAKTIYNYYSRNGKKNLDFKKIMVDSAKFTPSSNPPYLYPYSNNESYLVTNNGDKNFGHFGGDSALPFYNIFYWKASKSSRRDYLGLRTCLDEHANPEQRTILPNCIIDSHRRGHIKDLGSTPGKSFYTLKQVND